MKKLTLIKKSIQSDKSVDQVGNQSVDQVGNQSVDNQVGNQSVDNQVGNQSVDNQVGNQSVDNQVRGKTNWYCYLLKSNYGNRTYNGSTNNLTRRIRQHNGEITGGAKATSRHRPWRFYAVLTGFPDHVNALSCEWRIKHPNNARRRPAKFCGIEGRILGLNEVLKLDMWTKKCKHQNSQMKLRLWILAPFDRLLSEVPNHVEVHVLGPNTVINQEFIDAF